MTKILLVRVMSNPQEEITVIDDLMDDISLVDRNEESEETEGSEFEYDENDENFIHVDDIGSGVERIVDVLGGIFVNGDGNTISDILTKISDTLDKHVAAVEAHTATVEKQNKVLFKLSKVLEENSRH
jgi:nucleoside-diphosphate-sugar epimerase